MSPTTCQTHYVSNSLSTTFVTVCPLLMYQEALRSEVGQHIQHRLQFLFALVNFVAHGTGLQMVTQQVQCLMALHAAWLASKLPATC